MAFIIDDLVGLETPHTFLLFIVAATTLEYLNFLLIFLYFNNIFCGYFFFLYHLNFTHFSIMNSDRLVFFHNVNHQFILCTSSPIGPNNLVSNVHLFLFFGTTLSKYFPCLITTFIFLNSSSTGPKLVPPELELRLEFYHKLDEGSELVTQEGWVKVSTT